MADKPTLDLAALAKNVTAASAPIDRSPKRDSNPFTPFVQKSWDTPYKDAAGTRHEHGAPQWVGPYANTIAGKEAIKAVLSALVRAGKELKLGVQKEVIDTDAKGHKLLGGQKGIRFQAGEKRKYTPKAKPEDNGQPAADASEQARQPTGETSETPEQEQEQEQGSDAESREDVTT